MGVLACLLEERVESGSRVLGGGRGLLCGELLALPRLELRAAVRLGLLCDQRHTGLAALRGRAGIEMSAVRAGVQIGTAARAARAQSRSGAETLELAAARAAESARGGGAEAAAARRIAGIPNPTRRPGGAGSPFTVPAGRVPRR